MEKIQLNNSVDFEKQQNLGTIPPAATSTQPTTTTTTISPLSPLSPCLATMTTKTTTTTTTTTITEHNFLVPELIVISPRLENSPLTAGTVSNTNNNIPVVLVDQESISSGGSSSFESISEFLNESNNIMENKQQQQPNNNSNTDQPVLVKTTTSTTTTSSQSTHTVTPALDNRIITTSPPLTPMMDDCQIERVTNNSLNLNKSPPLLSSTTSTTSTTSSTTNESLNLMNDFINVSTTKDQTPQQNQQQNQQPPPQQQQQSSSAPSSPIVINSPQHSRRSSSSSQRCSSVPLIRNRIGSRPMRQKSPSSMGERPLLQAVLVQEEIKTLINEEDINDRDINGNTILHRVSIIGSMLAIRHMVLRGARVNSLNNNGLTPLHYAACANAQSVEVLLYYGALPNSKDNNRETPLFYAADRGQLSIVSLLISRGAKVTTTNKSVQRNPIHVAALKGYSNVLRVLLDFKCNINLADIFGSTAFHLCVYFSPSLSNLLTPISYCSNVSANSIDAYMTCCELLLQRGANITLQDNQGYTPIHIASSQGKKNIIDLILFYCKQQKNKTPQSIPNSTKFKKELKSEIVLFIPDNKGRLPLHLAAMSGHSRVLESLLGTGKRCTTIKDDLGMTPLCLASIFGHFDCVEYLYNLDPKLNQQCRFFSSSIDCSKTPIDPLGNDFRFALDGDYCDLVFIIEGRDIFAHSVILRQFKFFRDLIASSKSSASLHPSSLANLGGVGNNSHLNSSHQLHPYQYGGTYGSQYSYNNSYISRSHDDSSIHYQYSGSYADNYYDDDNYEYNAGYGTYGNNNNNNRSRTRSRMNSVVNPSSLTRIPVEKGINYELFRAILQFSYTSEIPREVINNTGKLSELLDFANQFDIESLSNLCVDTLSQHANGRSGTLEMSKYLLKQINNKHSADVTILYDGGQVVLAHSVILANRSTFFKLHFESYPVLSRSSIPLFPNNNNNNTITSIGSGSAGSGSGSGNSSNSVVGGNGASNLSGSTSNIAAASGTSTPMRKLSCPSSPAMSDIPTMGWVIDISEASQKAVFVMLEYLYSGCIPSGNCSAQLSLYHQLIVNHKPSSGAASAATNEMDVIDMLLLAKLAYALNLPILQQYSAVLLYNTLDPLKLVTVIKTIFSFDGQIGWGRTTSLEPMWSICLDWLIKKCNWVETSKNDAFLALGQKFIKDVKKERKDRKKKQKLNEKQIKSTSPINNNNSNSNNNSHNKQQDNTNNNTMRKDEKISTWTKELFRTVSSGFINYNNNNNSNNNNNNNSQQQQQQNNQSTISVQTPTSPNNQPQQSQPQQQEEEPNYTSKNTAEQNNKQNPESPKLTKQNSIANFLSKKKVFSTLSRKQPPNRSKSFVI